MQELIPPAPSDKDAKLTYGPKHVELATRMRASIRERHGVSSFTPRLWEERLGVMERQLGKCGITWERIVSVWEWFDANAGRNGLPTIVNAHQFYLRFHWITDRMGSAPVKPDAISDTARQIANRLLLENWAPGVRSDMAAAVQGALDDARALVASLRGLRVPEHRLGDVAAVLRVIPDVETFVEDWFRRARRWKQLALTDLTTIRVSARHWLFASLARKELHRRAARNGAELDDILEWLRRDGDPDGVSLDDAIDAPVEEVPVTVVAAPVRAVFSAPRPAPQRDPWD